MNASASPDPIEVRSSIDTDDGPLDVVARSHGERWWVRARCAGRSGSAIGPELGATLLAALPLCGVDAEQLDR